MLSWETDFHWPEKFGSVTLPVAEGEATAVAAAESAAGAGELMAVGRLSGARTKPERKEARSVEVGRVTANAHRKEGMMPDGGGTTDELRGRIGRDLEEKPKGLVALAADGTNQPPETAKTRAAQQPPIFPPSCPLTCSC
jgi:hypothetical protein